MKTLCLQYATHS